MKERQGREKDNEEEPRAGFEDTKKSPPPISVPSRAHAVRALSWVQFDLDEHFASPKQRLAQLTNKCTGRDDLDYFVEQAGEILGVTPQLKGPKGPKHILHFLMAELVKFKRSAPSNLTPLHQAP